MLVRSGRPRVKTQLGVGLRRELRLARGELAEPLLPLLWRARAREIHIQLEVACLGGSESGVQSRERRAEPWCEQREALGRARLDERRGEQLVELARRMRGAQRPAQLLRI